jgi:hypothetical protein
LARSDLVLLAFEVGKLSRCVSVARSHFLHSNALAGDAHCKHMLRVQRAHSNISGMFAASKKLTRLHAEHR